MSKSLGNFFTIRDVIAKYHPQVLRWFLLNTQYQQAINYNLAALDEVRGSGLLPYISGPALPYLAHPALPLTPCPALPCPALPCPALPCPALPYTLPCSALPLMPCPALPCPALPCPALPCLRHPALPLYLALSCPALPFKPALPVKLPLAALPFHAAQCVPVH